MTDARRLHPTLLVRLALVLGAVAGLSHCQTPAIYYRALHQATAAAASGVVPNVGQAVHLLTVILPTATADVANLQVRLEGSFDNAIYVPITLDVTSAKYTGSFAYAMTRGNGVYPYVRVRMLADSALPLTAYYTGGQQPIGNVYLADDRYVPTAGLGGYDRYTWAVCTGQPCQVATDVTNRLIALQGGSLESCHVTAKSAPAGAALIVDVRRNGVSMLSGTRLQLPAGTSGVATTRAFASPGVAAGDLLTLNIDQVGSSSPGQDVTVSCRVNY